MFRPLFRVVAPALLGAALLGGCAGSSSGAETTLSPNATAWRTVPPVSATAIPTSLSIANVQYTAKQGDYANSIASVAGGGCSGAEILAANPGVTTINAGDIIIEAGTEEGVETIIGVRDPQNVQAYIHEWMRRNIDEVNN